MRKLINVRLPVLVALMLVAGIVLGYLFVIKFISLFWIIAVILFIAVIFIICAAFRVHKFKLIFILIFGVFLTVGTINCYLRLTSFSKNEIISGANYTVTATVFEKNENSGREYIVLINATCGGEKLNGKIIAYLSDNYGDFCSEGYTVTFSTEIYKNDTLPYGKLSYYAQSNIKYYCRIYGGLTAEYGYSLFGSIRSAIRETLYDNLDGDTAAIAFAMLTGNTQGVDEGELASFRYGGIAHIFAVSGLHIGILYGLLSFLTKKLRLHKYLSAVICLAPLLFFAGVCGFTPSSVRAVIMCAVSMTSRLIHKKYDGLNSLSAAVVIILLISPLSLFSVGFQLSVCAVLGIFLLYNIISRPFYKLPPKIKGTICLSVSAQAATTPVMLVNFGYLSGASLLMNLLFVPVLSAIFVLMFLSVTVCVAVPLIAPLIIPYAALPLKFAVSFLVNTGFENSLIRGFGAGAFIIVYFIGLFILSDKINLKLLYRITAACCACIFLCTYTLIRTYYPFAGFKVVVSAHYGGGDVLIKSGEGNVLIVTENANCQKIKIMLNNYYSSDLDALILLGSENCVTTFDLYEIGCGQIYVYNGYIQIQPYNNIGINYESCFSLCGINFEFADGYSLIADVGGAKISICTGEYLPSDKCDLLITDNDAGESNFKVSFNNRTNENCVYDCGDFVFKIKDGCIK